MFDALPPGLVLILGAFALPLLPLVVRPVLLLGLPLAAMTMIWSHDAGTTATIDFLDYTLTPLKIDTLGRLFATIFALMAFVGSIFAMNQKRIVELVAANVYAGSAIGVALSGVGNRASHNLIHDCPRFGILYSGNDHWFFLQRQLRLHHS